MSYVGTIEGLREFLRQVVMLFGPDTRLTDLPIIEGRD